MLKDIKLIIFDLDGTLVDAYPAITGSFNYAMHKLNYPSHKSAVIRRAVGRGDENLLKPFIRAADLNKALAIYRRHHAKSLFKGSRLFAGTIKVLQELKKRNYKLAVASNRPTKFSWILIRHLRLKKYFSYVLCADKLKYGKPHPEILKKIMQKFRAKPVQTVYTGDMVIDAQAGRRAGVKTIIVTTGSSSTPEIRKEKPYSVIKKITGLLRLFP